MYVHTKVYAYLCICVYTHRYHAHIYCCITTILKQWFAATIMFVIMSHISWGWLGSHKVVLPPPRT